MVYLGLELYSPYFDGVELWLVMPCDVLVERLPMSSGSSCFGKQVERMEHVGLELSYEKLDAWERKAVEEELTSVAMHKGCILTRALL